MSIFRQHLSTFEPLRNRNLRIYVAGQGVSLVGTWMQMTAQAWLVWELSGSAGALGVVAMLGSLPYFFLGPWTGFIADRYDRRKLLIGTQVVAMSMAVVAAALIHLDWVRLWHMYVLAFFLGISAALDHTAQQAFLGDLAGIENVRKAVLINNITFQASRMLGPFLAGVLIGWIGTAWAFWLNALSFLAVIHSLVRVRADQTRRLGSGGSWRGFTESIRHIRGDRRIQYLMAFTVLVTVFGFSNFQILAAYASEELHGGSGLLGVLMGFSGAGAIFGAVLIVPLTHSARKIGRVFLVACLWGGGGFVVMAAAGSRNTALLAIFLLSAAFPVVMTNVGGLIQTLALPEMRGRLVSAWLMTCFGVQPFAALAVGYFAHWAGVDVAIGINGGMMIVAALLLFFTQRELREWELSSRPA